MITPEKLLRRALASGAELEIDGRVMNASRQRVKPVPVREVPKPAPAAAPAPVIEAPKPAGISREEVQAMLDARDAAWQMLFAELSASVASLRARKAAEYDFDFTYDERGMIVRGKATPNAQRR